MIIGAHAIIYSKDPEADRAFLSDVIRLPHVDVGGGWLIFGLPPSEVAVHPSGRNDLHELYFMVADVHAFAKAMKAKKIECGAIQNMGWGILTQLTLPGGGKIGVYQPRHARPPETKAPAGAKKAGPPKKAAPKAAAKKKAAPKKKAAARRAER